jgi:ribosomal protein S28E/S33
VLMAGGAKARFVAVNVNGPPADPSVVFCTAIVAAVGVLTVLVMTQAIFAAARMFAAGMVSTLPTSDPKLAGLPVMAIFESEQVAEVAVKFEATASVIATAVLKDDTVTGVGTAGVAVLVALVVMDGRAAAKFVAENVNGPPMAPAVIF